MLLTFIIVMFISACMCVAAYRDLTSMTIPNYLSLVLIAGFLIVTPFLWEGWAVFGEHLAVGGAVFLAGFVLFALGWIGGGDAKLIAAVSLWWQWPDMYLFVFYTTIAGGMMGLAVLALRNGIIFKIVGGGWLDERIIKGDHLPYGVAIAFGTLMTLPHSYIFKAAAGLA